MTEEDIDDPYRRPFDDPESLGTGLAWTLPPAPSTLVVLCVDCIDSPRWPASYRNLRCEACDYKWKRRRLGRSMPARSALTEAQDFIVGYLRQAGGSAKASDIIVAGMAAEHSRRTLERASLECVDKEDGMWRLVERLPGAPIVEDAEAA